MCDYFMPLFHKLVLLQYHPYYFLITYGVCKKSKYCNRISEKKTSLLLTNVHVLYVLEDEASKKKFSLSAYTYVNF